jgi:CHAD domain-containing protein
VGERDPDGPMVRRLPLTYVRPQVRAPRGRPRTCGSVRCTAAKEDEVASEQLEVEQKFDVDAEFALPDLSGLGNAASADEPVEHRLEAVYFDTPDLRLNRARVTLRRRTGGSDEGWHLKLPADDGARWERHMPLGRAARKPPKAVTAPVLGVLRGATPEPVATLRTRRVVTVLRDGGGRVLAEVADDTVTATTPAVDPAGPAEVHSWREVEVELGAGDEPLLAAVAEALVAAGARPSESASKVSRALAARLAATEPEARDSGGRPSAGDVVVDALRDQVAALVAADVLVRTDRPDAVHKVRVAARRLRSITAAARPVLDRGVTDPLRDELRWLGRELSGARDDEVALSHLRDLVAAEPEELVLGPVAARLQQTALRRAEEGRERTLATLSSPRYLRLLDDLHALLAEPSLLDPASGPARPELRKALGRAGRRLRRRLAVAAAAEGDERTTAVHEVRKAAKRARYTGELAAPVLGRRAKKLVTAMEEVQDVLGEGQDSVVSRELCRQLGLAAAAANENAWTYGRLHGLEQARAERADRAFRELAPSLRRVLRKAAGKR